VRRSVSITVTEDDRSFTTSRTIDNFWPGREDTPFMDILDWVVSDTVKTLESLGHG
jgi:hypothetical protein